MTDPQPTEERTVTLTANGLADLTAALAWVLRQVDREFTTATMTKIEVEQYMAMTPDDADEWRTQWSASVRGNIPATVGERDDAAL